jgi:hypothetical protein
MKKNRTASKINETIKAVKESGTEFKNVSGRKAQEEQARNIRARGGKKSMADRRLERKNIKNEFKAYMNNPSNKIKARMIDATAAVLTTANTTDDVKDILKEYTNAIESQNKNQNQNQNTNNNNNNNSNNNNSNNNGGGNNSSSNPNDGLIKF